MNILLIAGGWSKEREVSLNGAKNIHEALVRLGHNVTMYDPGSSLAGLCEAAHGQDFAFINLHGAPGEDGVVQALLDTVKVPYQGSGPAGSFLALNKDAAKSVFRNNNLITPDWILLTESPFKQSVSDAEKWVSPFGYPIFAKNNTGGSSLGMARISSEEAVKPEIERLFSEGGEYLVEPACDGVEVTCGVLGSLRKVNGLLTEIPESLPPILIRPKSGDSKFFDYTNKYVPGAAEEICPAPLPKTLTERIQQITLSAHQALGLRGYSRADFILTEDGTPMLLEVNTLPGMTSNSLVPQEARAVGMDFDQLIERLIHLGLHAAGKLEESMLAE
ncbi:D-alanine--D-alanine ligase [Desulfovibrio sp. OttesenSCG-928-C06]|nr:D-alanine--D-alanine ligase [Desulfovibrio sp. OttesenSCG-928-C06]